MRGGEVLPDGTPNPVPRRNYAWGRDGAPKARAQLYEENEDGVVGVADVGSHLEDRSPYGILDMTGNAEEWTETRGKVDGTRIVRGGCILPECTNYIVDYMAVENPRPSVSSGLFELGMRCATSD
jgi:formylglycine-generating enzyme required for sulfatase activity